MKEINTTEQNSTYPTNRKPVKIGYEFKSKLKVLGLPLIHISFAYKTNGAPVPAVGILSIGQFGAGVINFSQFGIGLFSISQFTIGLFAVGQIVFGYSCIAQVGFCVNSGYGQVIKTFTEIFSKF